jgi:hypothetical protein
MVLAVLPIDLCQAGIFVTIPAGSFIFPIEVNYSPKSPKDLVSLRFIEHTMQSESAWKHKKIRLSRRIF